MKITAKVLYTVSNDEVKLSSKAIQLPVKRTDNGALVDRVWFPLSQVEVEEGKDITSVRIPKWLLDEKVGIGLTIK